MSTPGLLRQRDYEAVKEYNAISKVSAATVHVERRAIEALLRYLLEHRLDTGRTTIRGLSRGLGLSYSKARRLLTKLVEEGILMTQPAGKSTSYLVSDAEGAIRRGYLSLDAREVQLLAVLSMAIETIGASRSPLIAMPKISGPAPFYYIGGVKLSEAWSRSLMAYSLLHPDKSEFEVPTEVSSDVKRLAELYRVWGDPTVAFGEIPLISLPLYRTILVPVMEETRRKAKREVAPGKEVRPPEYVPLAYGVLLRDLFFELDGKLDATEEEVEEGLRRVAEKQLRLLIHIESPLVEAVIRGEPPKGITKETLLFEASVLKFASLFALNLGADEELAMEVKELSDALVRMAEAMD